MKLRIAIWLGLGALVVFIVRSHIAHSLQSSRYGRGRAGPRSIRPARFRLPAGTRKGSTSSLL